MTIEQRSYALSLKDLPKDGKTITVTDQKLWQENITAFALSTTIVQPIRCTITVLPASSGVVISGTLCGSISLPCNRCLEPTTFELDHKFTDFADLKNTELPIDENLILYEYDQPNLNVAALVWEEFVLAEPVNPLCSPNCKGLCPHCGVNLNHTSCSCTQDQGDPRLAIFRNLKLKQQTAEKTTPKC